jgi:uncharacterized protein YciI
MSYCLFKLTPPRPTFSEDMNANEREVMQAHGAYWSSLAAARLAIFVGPVADPAGTWGVAIIEAADQPAARAIADKDPVNASGLAFRYDVFPVPKALLRE